jgi:YHYH protein
MATTSAEKSTSETSTSPSSSSSTTEPVLDTLPGFEAFAESVDIFADGDFWLVESNGLPTHNMMVGIRSWQQQFPVAQPYVGTNAWRIPRYPTRAAVPVSAKTSLYRGAIAIAVNGVPIFNALNNRGDDAYIAGELDEWGGHCGRADDYHYHVAPLHLQKGHSGSPIAYALDGYPIYGSTEPDGSPLRPLDQWNGHDDSTGGYHYHGTGSYPYINGGLVGEVRVVGDQIDPQPVTRPFRPPGEPLRGAVISKFESFSVNRHALEYTLNGSVVRVEYEVSGSTVTFTFIDSSGGTRQERYSR